MAERTKMVIEVELDLAPAQNQLKTFAAQNNVMTVPVASPVTGTIVGGAGGVAGLGGGSVLGEGAESAAIAAAQAQVTSRAEQFGLSPAAVGGGGGFYGAPNVRRLLMSGMFGLSEVAHAGAEINRADLMAGFAKTPEEAQVMRAEAVEKGSQGFFASLVFGIPNAFGMTGSPAQVADQAREMAESRKIQDDVRKRMFDLDDAGAVRSAYGTGGQWAAENERAGRLAGRRIDELTQHANSLREKLSERTPTAFVTSGDFAGDESYSTGGDFAVTGEARNTAQLDLNATNRQIRDAQEQAKFDADRRAEKFNDFLFDTGAETNHALMIAGGSSARDVARFDLSASGARRRTSLVRGFGAVGGWAADALQWAQQAAQEHGFQREDVRDIISSDAQIAVSGLQGAGQDFQASVVGIQTQGRLTVDALQDSKGSLYADRARRVMQAKIAAAVFQHNRDTIQSFTQQGTQSSVLGAELADDPLGAQISGIRGQASQATNAVTEQGIFGDARRWMIAFNANQQEQLATRNVQRQRSDIARTLEGAQERAEFSIRGGPLAGIRSELSSLLENEDLSVRGFLRTGDTGNADSRTDLTHLQIDALKAQFFSSFRYQEANPLNVIGDGDLSGVRKVFEDAQESAKTAGRGGDGKTSSGIDPALIQRGVEALEALVRDGIAALVG